MKIAAILTAHNRKTKTLLCLSQLTQICPNIDIYLTDDGSTDGTEEDVKRQFPHVHIQKGTGELFWNRGMLLAWQTALRANYDFYLWLNDDTILHPDFLEELLYCYNQVIHPCIISGLVSGVDTSRIIYGGSNQQKLLIAESDKPQPIHSLNGNVVLIPREVVDRIGLLDSKLHHDLGDVDYGFRCHKAGIGVYSTRKAVASGWANNYCRIRKWGTTISERFRRLYSPLGAPPSTTFYFRRKHYGIFHALVYILYLLIINILPDRTLSFFSGKRYTNG